MALQVRFSLLGVGVSLLLFWFAGCLQSPTVDCGNGLVCANDQVCFQASAAAPMFCATQGQIDACVEPNGSPKPDGALCGEPGSLDRCANGFCQRSLCGDGEIDSEIGETCDGDDVSSLQSCIQRGYDDGSLSCAACNVDTDTCKSYCGDGVADPDEECDGIDVNAQLNFACSSFGRAGMVICDSQCRIDTSACAAPWRSERIITLPPLSLDATVTGAFVVDAAEAWAVAKDGLSSTLIWWNGDRWLRPKLIDASQTMVDGLNESCQHVWATHGSAFVGCESGLVLQISALADQSQTTLDGPVVGIWGLSATDVWAATPLTRWHFNGATWAKQNETGLTEPNKALSGDVDDVFVLTSEALYRWNHGQATWVAVRQQLPLMPFERMQVFNENAIWLIDATGSTVSQYSVDLNRLTTADLGQHKFAVGAANHFFAINETEKNLVEQWQTTRGVGELRDIAMFKLQPADLGVRHTALVAAGQGAVWVFASDAQAARPGLVGDVQKVVVAGPNPVSVFTNSATRYTVAQSRNDALYVTGGNATTLIYRMDVHKPSAVAQGVSASPVVDLAPVSAVADELLALDDHGKVTAFKPTAQTLSPVGTSMDASAIWSDGRTGFAVTASGLQRYESAGNWTQLVPTAESRPLLAAGQRLTGGSLNNKYTLWMIPPNTPAPTVVQFASVAGDAVTVSDLMLPSVGDNITAIWSNGVDLWLGRKVAMRPYLAHWNGVRWTNYTVPTSAETIEALWSNGPAAIWVSLGNGALLRFDGSSWHAAFTAPINAGVLLNQTPGSLWALLASGTDPLVEINSANPPLSGGFCPAQQELFCRDSGHGVSAGPRSISTIVGGRFGNSHYVLNSPILGTITFDGNLPAEVEAVWALPDRSGTCPAGVPLGFAANGTTTSVTQTVGRSRYFLTLRPRNPADTTEYPVTLDYSCHRLD